MAQHSAFNADFKGRIACGMPIIPFKTKLDGPASNNFQPRNNMDIIDEAFLFFRVNVLFKNFEIKGPGDKVLVYLFVLLSHLFKCVDQVKDQPNAKKRLGDIVSAAVALPKDKSNFMSNLLEDGQGHERDFYVQYVKQLRAETVTRFLQRFFGQGIVHDDFKFWSGLAKKKFMGLNYALMF